MLTNMSGLTRYQVQKRRLALPGAAVVRPLALRPFLVLAGGLALLLVALGHVLVAIVAAVGLLAASFGLRLVLARRLAQLSEASTPVLVVRDGLSRCVLPRDLVPGDVLRVQAGMILPVDVALGAVAAKTPWWLAGMQASVAQTTNRRGLAGSRVLDAGLVTVVAVGADCAVFAAADATQATAAPVPHFNWHRLAARVRQVWLQLASLVLPTTGKKQAARIIRRRLALPTFALVVDRHAAEVAFRYNQEPVSWLAA